MKIKKPFSDVWSSVDEYVDFAIKHKVFGIDAVNLKKN